MVSPSLPVGVWFCDDNGRIVFANEKAEQWFPRLGSIGDLARSTRVLGPFGGWEREIRTLVSAAPSQLHAWVLREHWQEGEDAGPAADAAGTTFRLSAARLDPTPHGSNAAAVLWIEPLPNAGESIGPIARAPSANRTEASRTDASAGEWRPDMDGSPDRTTPRTSPSAGAMIATVAHELNNPLDGILRYVNLSLRIARERGDDRLGSYLTEAGAGLRRMMQILRERLDQARESHISAEAMDINETVERAIRAIAPVAESTGVIVTSSFRCSVTPRVRGVRLQQVLGNLVRNALDAMPAGGRLTITTDVVDSQMVIEVADTGIGLPLDVERVFEPFFTTKAPGKGTGLGLAISRDFVQEWGGTLSAAHGHDGGAVFTVRIPVASLDAPPTH